MAFINNDENELRSDDQKQKTESTRQADNHIPKPPDGGWGWVIVFASLMCNTVVDGIGYAFGVFLPEFVDYFDEPRSKVSLIGSLLCGTYLLVGPIVSGLINKFGCRPVSMAGGVLSATAFILARFSPNVDVLILTYGFMGGFGFGMIYLPSVISVGFYFERKRAVATGIAVCGSGIGTFIFAPLTKFLLDQYDWKNALFIISGIAFNACVCGALLRPLVVSTDNEAVSEAATGQFLDTLKDIDTELEAPRGELAPEMQPLVRNTATDFISRSQPELLGGSRISIGGSKSSLNQKDVSRPLLRKDIFYSGSIHNIVDLNPKCEDNNNFEKVDTADTINSSSRSICPCIPRSVVNIFADMWDVSLFTNVGFLCICVGNVLSMAGFYVPYVYIVDRALLAGIDKTKASILLSVIGITNTVGRILFGLLADLKFVNSLLLNNLCMSVAGVAILLTPFANSYAALIVAAGAFGLTSAAFISLTSIVLCDLLGLGKLTNAFGLLSMGRGIAGIIGPPIAGAVFQSTGSYDASFYLGGSLFLSGTFLHFVLFLPCFKNRKTSEFELETKEGTKRKQVNEE